MSRVVAIDSDGNEYYPFEDWDAERICNTENCIGCANQNAFPVLSPCINCIDGNPLKVTGKYYRKQITTNADRIRAMSDEELAEWIAYRQGCFERQDGRCSKYGTCRDCWLDWLKEEYKNE